MCDMYTWQDADHRCRSSGQQADSLAPPASPYPQQIEPSPVDSNGTESTDIDEDAQEDANVKSPDSTNNDEAIEVQSPDIEITSPASVKSVGSSVDIWLDNVLTISGQPSAEDQHEATC